MCTQRAQTSYQQGQRQCSVIGDGPDGETTIFKNKHVAQHDGLRQKDYVRPKLQMENTPSVSSPPPSSSFLPVSPPLFPKPSHTHTHTHTHTTVLPFPFSPLIHPPVWFCGTDAGSAEEKYRGVKHVCSPMKRAERTGRKCEMTLKINVSLGERETLRGPKIAGQTKA